MDMAFPSTQAVNNNTFLPPPFEQGILTLPELYEWNASNNPDHPLFHFEDGAGGIRTIRWPEVVRATHRAADLVSSRVGRSSVSSSRPTVVAVLAASDTITYMCSILGVLRAGFTVFPISPRNSAAAVAHLLEETDSVYLFLGAEPALQSLARTAIRQLEDNAHYHDIKISDMPVFEDLFPPGSSGEDAKFIPFPSIPLDMDAQALILHTSGSTSFPKPIYRTHRALLQLATVPWFGDIDLCGLVMGCHSMPMFHGLGVLQMNLVATTGLVMAVFKPASPAVVPTPVNVLAASVASGSELVACVPAFIEAWYRSPENVKAITKMKGLMYGGGPLNKEIGDDLASKGISIYVTYASTECGPMSTFLRSNPGMDWEYFTFSGHTRPELLPYGDGTVECVMISHELHVPRVINTKVGGRDAYATSDLLLPHPVKPGLWKVYGRADDQIMLSTGEKTNPGPLEAILSQDPHVQSAVMFGRGQLQNGVLIDPKKEFAFDPTDESKLRVFRHKIWPTVERLNGFAPTHSRLFKEMILVTSPSKPFTYTAKGTARRQAVISDYEAEIKGVYTAVAETTQGYISPPEDWSVTQTLEFIRKIVASVLVTSVDDDADIFQHGCDSLQAVWVRNSILRAIRQTLGSGVATRIPINIIYKFPSVSSLASFVFKTASTTTDDKLEGMGTTDKIHELNVMIEKYSSSFPAHDFSQLGDVVLLTGSTGGFGCNILAQLAVSESVARVYAVNRKSPQGQSLLERQRDALQAGGHDVNILHLPKIKLVEADLSASDFRIETDVLNQIRASVTHIIHNAWRVDFNLALSSFESNISGVRNLVDLALSSPHPSPPRLIFISSVGVFRNPSTRGLALEQPILDAHIAVGTGYSESKWAAERILTAAAETTTLRPVIIRVGQLTGDPNGTWNEKEWFPSLVKSAKTLKCLPNFDSSISWIPSYEAAKALTEMRNADTLILHLAHPKPVRWLTVMEPIAHELGATLVPYSQWFSALEHSLSDSPLSEVEHMRRNPALRLMNFFRHVDLHPDKEPLGVVRLATDQAVKVSTCLNSLKQLDAEDAMKWVAAWRASGFIRV